MMEIPLWLTYAQLHQGIIAEDTPQLEQDADGRLVLRGGIPIQARKILRNTLNNWAMTEIYLWSNFAQLHKRITAGDALQQLHPSSWARFR